MVFESAERVAGEVPPPTTFHRPVDAPPPPAPLREEHALRRFRDAASAWRARPARGRLRARAWAGRVSGRSDRRLLDAVTDATDAIAGRCDVVMERLAAEEAVVADVARALGEELTQLRVEVVRLREAVASLHDCG